MQEKMPTLKKVMYGTTERYSFSKLDNTCELPDLLEIQKDTYKEFLETGILEILQELSPITDYSGKVKLYFTGISFGDKPKQSIKEYKIRRGTYSVPLKVNARLVLEDSGEAIEQNDIYLCDIPYMTAQGSFVFNGTERVIVSQVTRSPSVYFTRDKDDNSTLKGQLYPSHGMWVEIEQGANELLKVVLDRTHKITLGLFLKCFGYTNEDIMALFGNHRLIKNVLEKEPQTTQEEALIELARKTRPADVPSAESTRNYINLLFFSDAYYDINRVGRYKMNLKLSIANRITGHISADNIAIDDEIVVKAGEEFTYDVARRIQDAGINEVYILANGERHLIRGNNRVRLSKVFPCDEKELGILEEVYYPTLCQILKENKTKEKRLEAIRNNAKELLITTLTMDDILATVSYYLDLCDGIGEIDNIDHLSNKRVVSVGELLGNAFSSGIKKLSANIKETLQGKELAEVTPSQIINPRPVNKSLKDFIAQSQLSQFMDQINPLSGLTQKRRLSAVGPGGVKKERASAELRDIHYTHYGRICAIETPEGQSIGLISTLAAYAKVNEYGFLETPYRKVNKETGVVENHAEYHMADIEDKAYICQATEPLDEEGKFVNKRVICRHGSSILEVPASRVDYMDVSPRQLISAAASLIPFVENDDSARALMGSNMQRQAVPVLRPEAPIVGTGMERPIAKDCGAIVSAPEDGTVEYVSSVHVDFMGKSGKLYSFPLIKFDKTNAYTCQNQKPAVKKGQKVKKGDVLIDGFSTKNGELALGKNVLVGYMNWEGYNYEDAILISERIVKDDVYTSINLKDVEMPCRSTKLGDEEITRDIPNLGEDALKNLDENGIIRVGSEVRPGDILVGKVTPKGETELTPEERLLRAIFGDKAREVRDTSLRVKHGCGGTVVDVQVLSKKNKDELDPGVNMLVKVYVAQRRKLSVGDKMSGRHGNKGVVSRILPEADMPFLADGRPLDLVLNPLGIPSRMNIGQVLEVHLGLVAESLGWKVATPAFDGATPDIVRDLLVANGFPEDGKIQLYDGRTGEPFDHKATVGYKYMLKLDHMVDSKMHARSTGPYSLVTQQPLGGKAMFGGQRFGEMEVWALEAYGASALLQEMLTVKSDDIVGRTKTYEAIVKGEPIAEPGIPESFKVLVKELQSLGLDMKILTEDNQEVSIAELSNDEMDVAPNLGAEVEQELKDVSINFDELLSQSLSDLTETGVTDEDIANASVDPTAELYGDFEDLDE